MRNTSEAKELRCAGDAPCVDCNGTGEDPERFFNCCRRCDGTGKAANEHCVRCGVRGPQCKPLVTLVNGMQTISYCGID